MRRIIMAVLTSAAMILSLVVLPVSAMADSVDTNCAKELNIEVPSAKDAALKTPVILVHGLWGDPASMDTLYKSLKSIGAVALPYSFDYQSTNATWVTNGGMDRRLAKTIVCYSKLYDNKKVIIVAHSMGGLLARAALDLAEYGTFAKNVVGHVVTIGTPNKGASLGGVTDFIDITMCNVTFMWWGSEAWNACRTYEDSKAASAMRPGSPQLAKLPHFPKNIPIKAIAGDVRHLMCTGWGCSEAFDYRSDTVVSVDSATAEYTTMGVGDGKAVLVCNDGDSGHNGDESWCSHTNIHKSIRVQEIVKKSIDAYLASMDKPVKVEPVNPKTTVTTKVDSELHDYYMYDDFFERFSLPMLASWGVGMSQPNKLLNVVDNTQCAQDNSQCPHIQFMELYSPHQEVAPDAQPVRTAAVESCRNLDKDFVGWSQPVQHLVIGGKQAEFYSQLLCGSAGSAPLHVSIWYIPERKVLAIAHDSEEYQINKDAVATVLNTIEWH